MPLADNVIFDLGLGPVLLPGSKGPAAAPPSWLLVTVMGTFGAGLLVAYLVSSAKRLSMLRLQEVLQGRDRFILFAWCFLVLYLFIICLRGFFDRYLIAVVPFLLLIVADIAGKQPAVNVLHNTVAARVAVCFVLLLCIFSTLAVHDYFSWNRARWQAWHYLIDKQATSPVEINGGLEINGWLSSDPQSGGVVPTNSAELSRGDKYAIALSRTADYRVLAQFPFERWLFCDTGYIFALRKSADRMPLL
jgi:hypothetical protein